MHMAWASGFIWSLLSTSERPWRAGDLSEHALSVSERRSITLGSPRR